MVYRSTTATDPMVGPLRSWTSLLKVWSRATWAAAAATAAIRPGAGGAGRRVDIMVSNGL